VIGFSSAMVGTDGARHPVLSMRIGNQGAVAASAEQCALGIV
jgi:hypothetical protein